MATASALTNYVSHPGVLMDENFADVLDARFKYVKRRVWKDPVQGLKYWKVESTKRAYEKYSYILGAGLVPKNRDVDRLPRASLIQGFDNTLTPETYRLALFIERRLRETDQFGVIDKQMADLNQSAKDTIELYAALPFNTAFSGTVAWVCADGMNLCDTGHPYPDIAQGTWDNDETNSAPTQAAIATMRLNFRKNKNGRGRTRPLSLDKLVIPADLEDTVVTNLGSILKPGSGLNDKNYLTKYGITYEVWNYLTSTSAWFGMAPKDDLYELIWLWGSKPQIESISDNGNPDVYGKRIRMIFVTGCNSAHSLRGNSG